ncbi:mycofactocin precursor MftA [Janibacter melonis]|nr:mycofactocin precursor MftA [Janibacter melonis]
MSTDAMPQQDDTAVEPQQTAPDDAVTADTLIEEVSIDGMCGVY